MPEAVAAAISSPHQASSRRLLRGEALVGLLLNLPAGIAYGLMLLLPSLATILLAFTDYELGAMEWGWIGAANFEEMLEDRGFAIALRNTIIYVGFVTPISILLGLGAALLIEAGMRGRALFRAVFFLPVVSLTVAMAAAWQYLLHPTIGPLNAFLRQLGVISPPYWLSSSDWVLFSLGAIGVWENIGYNMVLFLAGLSAIPRELYQAAEVDGTKSWLDRFRLVTWPMLGPTTLFVLTITMTLPREVTVAFFWSISFWALREFITMTPTRRGDHRTEPDKAEQDDLAGVGRRAAAAPSFGDGVAGGVDAGPHAQGAGAVDEDGCGCGFIAGDGGCVHERDEDVEGDGIDDVLGARG